MIIPALDEILNLRQLLPKVFRELEQFNDYASKILVIVGVESSESEINEIMALGCVPIIRGPSNTFGDAIRSGFAEAKAYNPEFILIMDADGSHNPRTIPRLIRAIDGGGFDVVIASRYAVGGGSHNTTLLKFMSKVLNFTYSKVLGINAKDVSTNYKIYRGVLLADLHLSCQNFDIVEEILLEVKRIRGGKLEIKEIPDHFEKRIFGESKRNLALFILSYITTLLRLRFRSIR